MLQKPLLAITILIAVVVMNSMKLIDALQYKNREPFEELHGRLVQV